ncbi:MAG: restriction endonuclease [Anaerolineae bacterium]
MVLGLIDVPSFLTTFIRLGIVVFLLLIVVVFVRVLIELTIERRRKETLAATRDIRSLSPSEFEAYVGVLFERAGYRVRQTGGSGDRGIDLVVSRNGKSRVVQCKRYEDDIGPSAVRELIGAMTNAGATHGFLVTTSDFTPGAREEARKAPYEIGLLDGRTIVRWAGRYGLPAQEKPGDEAVARS